MRVRARFGVVAAALALALGPAAVPAHAAPPANDALANPQRISGWKGAVYGTLAGATVEPDCREPYKVYPMGPGDRSVWYAWTPPTNGWVRFDLHPYGGWHGYAEAFDHRPGNCFERSSATYLESGPGYAEMEVTRGKRVMFGVYSVGPENVGTFALTWRAIARRAPMNDHLSAADALRGRYGKEWGSNMNATRQAGEPAHAGRTGGRSSWFRWTVPQSGPAMVHAAAGSLWNCLVAVYRGTSVGALTPVASDTNGGDGCTARFTATAGTTYVVAVDGDRGAEAMWFRVWWNSGPRPPNDAIGNARTITGHAGVLAGNNRGATDEPGDPTDRATRSGSSVWYRWTAPDDGDASFWAEEPTLQQSPTLWEENKRIAVFGGSPGALRLLAASEEPPRDFGAHVLFVTRGTTYWIQVTGIDRQVVHYDLIWRLTPDANDEFAERMTLPPTGSVVVDTSNATPEPGEPPHGLRGYPARRSLWFRWTAPQTGTVTFDSYEGPYGGWHMDESLAAYTGTAVDALTRVPVTRESWGNAGYRWYFAVTAGTTYAIAVDDDSYWRDGRRMRLSWYYGTRTYDPPAVAITGPAPGAVVRGPVTFDVAATDDDGIWATGLSHDHPATYHAGPEAEAAADHDVVLDTERYRDGPHRPHAIAWDAKATYGTSSEHPIVVDNHPPGRLGLGGGDYLTSFTTKGVRWEADEPLARAQCSFDGGAYVDCQDTPGIAQGERSYAGLADGVHTFRVVFTDLQGRRSLGSFWYWWIVDTKGVGVLPPDDRTAPTVTAPVPDIMGGHPVGHTTAPVRLRWTGRDATSGIQRYDVERSVDGGAWRGVASRDLEGVLFDLPAGRTYRFRVRAFDWAGNASAWAYSRRFAVGLAQETGWSLSPSWQRIALTNSSGGYVARSGVKGAVARYAFTGRSVALYGPKRPTLGLSAIYLDGVRVATVNQFYEFSEVRAALFVRNGLNPDVRHVLEVRSLGTAGEAGGGTAVAIDAATVVR